MIKNLKRSITSENETQIKKYKLGDAPAPTTTQTTDVFLKYRMKHGFTVDCKVVNIVATMNIFPEKDQLKRLINYMLAKKKEDIFKKHKDRIIAEKEWCDEKKQIETHGRDIMRMMDKSVGLNLRHLAMTARNTEYKPHRFGALIMRIRNPKTTALIFQTGKVVVPGATNLDDTIKASRKYASILKKLHGNNPFFNAYDIKIENMVGSLALPWRIRLGLFNNICNYTTYEPELFPGLKFSVIDESVKANSVCIVFDSGKVNITGVRSLEQMNRAMFIICQYIDSNTIIQSPLDADKSAPVIKRRTFQYTS